LGYLAVGQDGRIAAIGPGEPPSGLAAETTLDAGGKIILPGFVSAHSHLWQGAFRGAAADRQLWDWIDIVCRKMAGQLSADDFYWLTLHGALDHLLHGITSVYNFTYGARPGLECARHQWRAGIDSGVRFIHAHARPHDAATGVQRADLEALLAYVQPDRARATVLGLSLADTPRSREGAERDAQFMRDYNLPNQTHYLECPIGKVEQQAAFAHYAAAGLLGPRFSFGHFIHTTEPMLQAVSAAGSGMVWNPLSNGRLGSGLADIPRYRELGVKIGMGVDSQGCADVPDPFENMRAGLYAIRAGYESAAILQPIDVLRFHTLGGAEVLGIDDQVGSLAVGKFGDLLVIDPAIFNPAPVFDPYATLVFACNVRNIEQVYVGGVLQAKKQRILTHDFPALYRELSARVGRLALPPLGR
jgi:cytosine/adenosine deaminase-related metal-dependent hydrolase